MLADFQICINVLLSEVFFLQNVMKTKDEFLSKKLTSTINNKTNSKKNIYILREKKKKRESQKHLNVTTFYFLLEDM